MAPTRLTEQWARNVYVASDKEFGNQTHSATDISIEQAATSWMAFKALLAQEKVRFNYSDETLRAVAAYKQAFPKKDTRKLWEKFRDGLSNKDMNEAWAIDNPHNLLLMYRANADIVRPETQDCIPLENLVRELAEHRGIDVPNKSGLSVLPLTIQDDESVELAGKLFHPAAVESAIELMRNTVYSRVKTVSRLDHS